MRTGIMIMIMAMLLLVACTAETTPEPSTPEATDAPVVDNGPIEIGAMAPLTGDFASVGQNVKAAMVLAEREVNEAGGINGRPIKLLFEDSQCLGIAGSNAANKLYRFDKVDIVVGPTCSGAALAAADIAESEGKVLLSNCASNPDITTAGDYIFRDYPSDAYAGAFGAKWLFEQGYRKAATFYCLADYCTGITDVFEKTFKELGGEIVASEAHEQGARDMRTELTKLRSAEPDVLYFVSYTDEIIVVLKQIKELGWDIQVFGADSFEDPAIPDKAGAAAEGAQWTIIKTDLSDDFKEKMLAQTGEEDITVCSPQGYDAVHIVAKLMREGATTGPEFRDALYAMQTYEGVSGPIAFDENGDVIGAEYDIKEYQDGKLVVIA